MGFVKTSGEIARMARALTKVRFDGGRYLGIDFESASAFIHSVLPPPLEPLGNNVMSAMVCQFERGSCGAFRGGAVYIAARYKDIVGQYTLAMYMDSDNALLFGRDLYGEPKKIAAVDFGEGGGRAWGTVQRGGATLIQIEATFGSEGSLAATQGTDFNYKASFSADGDGLADDPMLTATTLELVPQRHVTGQGRLVLDGTVHDPLHEIPIGRILGTRLIESDFAARSFVAATVPAADFLPYAYGRYPDWGVFLDQGATAEAGA
jgi:acetoacetate decarboxylase